MTNGNGEPSGDGQQGSDASPSKAPLLGYLWNVHDNCQQTIRFADVKSLGLIAFASGLLAALGASSDAVRQSTVSTGAALLAAALLLASICLALSCVFPRLRKGTTRGYIFAGDVGDFGSAEVYWVEVSKADRSDLAKRLAQQIYVISITLRTKLRAVGLAVPLAAAGAVSCALALAVAPAQPTAVPADQSSPELRKVTVAQFGDLLLYLPLYIAQDAGVFEKHGLEVQISSTGGDDKTFAAVLAGEAQFGIADPTFAAIAAERGQPGRVVASLVDGMPNYAVSLDTSHAAITTPKELAPLTIATVPAPSTSFALMSDLYTRAGLKPAIRQVAAPGLLAAVEAGDADAALLIEPWVSGVVRSGGSIVVSLPEFYPEFALTGVTTTPDLIARDPELVRHFLAALRDAITIFYVDEDATLSAARAMFPNEDPRDLLSGIRRHRDDQIHPFNLGLTDGAWRAAVELRQSTGELSLDSLHSEVVDRSFVETR